MKKKHSFKLASTAGLSKFPRGQYNAISNNASASDYNFDGKCIFNLQRAKYFECLLIFKLKELNPA